MEEEQTEERVDPVALFSPKIQEAVTGLIHLGYLTKTIKFCGHTFILETIRPHMKFALGQAMEPFRNTLLEPQVWSAMHVGLALTSVDGKRDFCPPTGENQVEFALARLQWLTDETGWWQPTIDFLHAEYVQMEMLVREAVVELNSLAQAGRASSLRSPGFSAEPESSTDEMNSDSLS